MRSKILLSLMLSFFSLSCFAGSGKGIISHWQIGENGQQTNIYLSNITEHDLEVKITFYTSDGTIYSESTIVHLNYDSGNTVIKARNTGLVYVAYPTNSTQHYGFAVVEWNNINGENDVVGLIGHASWAKILGSSDGRAAIPINMGVPF